MAQKHDKTQLVSELASARAELSANLGALRRNFDFPARAKKSFKSNPVPWLGGAGVVGLILSRLASGREKKRQITVERRGVEPTLEKAGKAGLLLAVLKMVLDFARPAITAWARKRASDYFAARATSGNFRR